MLADGIKSDDATKELHARKFLELHEAEFGTITAKAKESLDARKYNRPQSLPVFQDVSLLNNYIVNEVEVCGQNSPSVVNYVRLAKLNLAAIILFNRKRSGEAERIKKENYTKGLCCDQEADQEIIKELSIVERKLVHCLKRVEIRGKKGRRVAILLTEQMVANINTMIKMRESIEMDRPDDYLFARPGNNLCPYRGHIVLSELAKEAGCQRPDLITSTKLRKHLAAMSVVLNIEETMQDTLADFMGHDIRVHRQFYRLPLSIIQKAKVAKILTAVNTGQLGKYSGKSLDDVDISTESKYMSN